MNLWLLLAATVLLSIGLSIIFHKKHHAFKHAKAHPHLNQGPSAETLTQDEFVTIESNFGEQTKYVHAKNLKRVDISGNFCSIKVFFDQCIVDGDTLYIDIGANFCGIELSMPRNWLVQNNINTFAAEFKDKDAYYNGEQPIHVIMQGSANFAEIKVRHI